VALATAAQRRMNGFKAQSLANTAWAFAKAEQFDVNVFKALAKST